MGATRRQLTQIQLVEYTVLGVLATVTGGALAIMGNALLAKYVFKTDVVLPVPALLASMAEIPAEIVFGFATGNIARMRNLRQGLIEVGRPADFVFLDKAQHSAGKDLLDSVQLGDIPGVGMVMIDGLVRCQRSRNTPPATEVPVFVS